MEKAADTEYPKMLYKGDVHRTVSGKPEEDKAAKEGFVTHDKREGLDG